MSPLTTDIQLRLARLSTDLLLLQRAVQELMHECAPQPPGMSEGDLIAAAQYRALEAALHAPDRPARPAAEEGAELLAWPGFTEPAPMRRAAMRA
ncbi:hypothetical protein FHT32_000704 [Variovorax sp. SG517]|uniref:hypothetical protein n=1 Tax=Variovorax sp. SG517 TaxID=2587117 RepID=UPI00159D73E6|nr:hypothetical protein [Variovorax sp. SG517]NVM87081.1 hypothetical protein [Variovorax sp. SG517]